MATKHVAKKGKQWNTLPTPWGEVYQRHEGDEAKWSYPPLDSESFGQPNLAIEVLRVEDLVPYANNAKLHDEAQVQTIIESMRKFGNCDPIAVWRNKDGQPEIVEGHGRLLALMKLGAETCPVIFLDHLTDDQRRAYTHVHNQTTMNSGWDMDVLRFDMQELDFDWDGFGFDLDFGFAEDQPEEYREYDDKSDSLKETYEVIITCKDESDLQATFDKLSGEGYECRVLTL